MRIEVGLACSIGVCTEGGVAVAGVGLAVVEDDDAAVGQDRRWPYFGEAANDVTGTFGEDFDGLAGGVLQRCPMDEVARGCEVDGDFAQYIQ